MDLSCQWQSNGEQRHATSASACQSRANFDAWSEPAEGLDVRADPVSGAYQDGGNEKVGRCEAAKGAVPSEKGNQIMADHKKDKECVDCWSAEMLRGSNMATVANKIKEQISGWTRSNKRADYVIGGGFVKGTVAPRVA